MNPLYQLSKTRGYFLRREAIKFGCDDRVLHRGVRRGTLVRIRQGAYCHTELWQRCTPVDQHLARAMASYDLTSGNACLSHVSALAVHGAPLWNVDLDGSHLTRLDGASSRNEAAVTHHRGDGLRPEEVVEDQGRRVTAAARSTIDAMTLMSMESGVIVGDWMLHQKKATHQELWDVKTRLDQNPRTRALHVLVPFLDHRSESPGESRCRYLFWLMGLPCPELQWEIYDSTGRLIAKTDFAWPEHGVYGEFDGKVKYGRLLKPGQSAGDVIFAEKTREDAVRRETDGTMVRWTWSDIHPQSAPTGRLLELLRPAA